MVHKNDCASYRACFVELMWNGAAWYGVKETLARIQYRWEDYMHLHLTLVAHPCIHSAVCTANTCLLCVQPKHGAYYLMMLCLGFIYFAAGLFGFEENEIAATQARLYSGEGERDYHIFLYVKICLYIKIWLGHSYHVDFHWWSNNTNHCWCMSMLNTVHWQLENACACIG